MQLYKQGRSNASGSQQHPDSVIDFCASCKRYLIIEQNIKCNCFVYYVNHWQVLANINIIHNFILSKIHILYKNKLLKYCYRLFWLIKKTIFSLTDSLSHSRRSIGGAWPYWPCWAPIVGWGAFGSPGPGPGPPWDGRLPVEPAGLPPRHPGAPTLWLSEVPPSGPPLPFSGWRPRLSLRWFSWGSRALGVSGCLGPGSFPCLLHALRDGAVVPHTHY